MHNPKNQIHLLMLACAAAIVYTGCATPQKTASTQGIGLLFPKQKHLTVEDIDGEHPEYRRQLVLLDVVVKIQRDVPVVAFVGSKRAEGSLDAHLLSLGSDASELKQGKTYRIEGLIVDGPFYGAYVIYLYHAFPL